MRRLFSSLIVSCLLVLPLSIQAARGAVYYVDPAGNDSNPGSSAQPWRTIQYAVGQVVAGDTVTVQAGTYVESVVITISGTALAPITFLAAVGAVLESPDPLLSFSAFDIRAGAGNIVLDGFEARAGFHETIFVRGGAHDIVVRNCNVHGNRVGIWIAGATNVEVDNCLITANTVLGMHISGLSSGITVRNTTSSGNDDGWGCFGDADGFTVQETVSNVSFFDCVASNNGEDGFDIQGDQVLISRSESRNNTCSGIKLNQNSRVENSIVSGNNIGIMTTSYYNADILIEVVNSTVADNAGQQLYFKEPAGTPPQTYRALVHNVVVRGPGKAIEATSSVVLTEHHNILFREATTFGLIVQHLVGGGDRRYSGQEINTGVWTADTGNGTGTWAVDPDFVDPVTLTLLPDSTGVDGGDAAGAPVDDRNGAVRPQGSTYDAGAYESGATLVDRRPWADPGPNRTKTAGRRVDFTSFGSVDPDGAPLSYVWDFGDGSPTATGSTAAHVYTIPGQYTATLTVSDGSLSRARAAIINVVPAPTATPSPTPTPTGTLPPTNTPTSTPTVTLTPTLRATATPIVGSPCGAAPRLGCRAAGRTKFLLRENVNNPNRQGMSWKWIRGAATTTADFGDPVTGGTRYALCLFATGNTGTSLLMSLEIPPGGTCRGKPCWKATRRGGFNYRDRDATNNGIRRALLKPGTDTKAKIIVVGAGPNLQLPYLPLDANATLTVQMVSDGGACWEGTYTPPVRFNTTKVLRAFSSIP